MKVAEGIPDRVQAAAAKARRPADLRFLFLRDMRSFSCIIFQAKLTEVTSSSCSRFGSQHFVFDYFNLQDDNLECLERVHTMIYVHNTFEVVLEYW